MRYYYAFDHYYSNDIRNEGGERIGTIRVFKSKRERDRWTDRDQFKREDLTAREARKYLLSEYGTLELLPDSWRYEPYSYILRYCPTAILVDAWRRANCIEEL